MLYRIYGLLILILSLPITPAFGQTLTLNSTISPPLTNESKTGFLDVIAGEAFRRNNLHLKLIKLPAERGLRNANAGIEDGELVRVVGMERIYKNLVPVPEKMMDMDFTAFSKNPSISIKNWQNLGPYSIGYIRGWKIYERNVPKGTKVITATNPEQLFTLLAKGRIDIALYTRFMGLEIIRHKQISHAKLLLPPLATKEMYMFLHKGHRKLVKGIGAALANIKSEGIYQREFEKLNAQFSGMN